MPTIQYLVGGAKDVYEGTTLVSFLQRGLDRPDGSSEFLDQPIHTDSAKFTEFEAVIPEASTFSVLNYACDPETGERQWQFSICVAKSGKQGEILGFKRGYVRGEFEVVARGDGKARAVRLKDWWNAGDGSVAYAYHCGHWITQHGVHELPPLNNRYVAPWADRIFGPNIAQMAAPAERRSTRPARQRRE